MIENLKSTNKMTVEEQKEFASKGGKASAIARKKRKSFREALLAILEEDKTQKNLLDALIKRAGKNDLSANKAFEIIRDTIGEKPVDKVMVAEVDPKTIKEIEDLLDE